MLMVIILSSGSHLCLKLIVIQSNDLFQSLLLTAKLVKPTKCQKMAASKDAKKFKPACKPNGDFKAKQCLPAAIAGAAGTHCWCSMPDGKIIPDTIHSSAKFPKYNCAKHAGKKKKSFLHKTTPVFGLGKLPRR